MDRIEIEGGVSLKGRIPIAGAKNAALPIMCAALLTDGDVQISNLPDLADIRTLRSVLETLGVKAEGTVLGGTLKLTASQGISTTAPYDMVRKMRASILVLGPLVARFGKAKVSLPGGCAIGTRPIDIHLNGLEAMGAKIRLEDGYVYAEAAAGLSGAAIELAFPSVGATENLMMAATLARGETTISNAAREPEIADLSAVLALMGAKIDGAGESIIRISGSDRLGSADHGVMPDRIEAGSFAVAAAITRGEVFLEGADAETMGATLRALESVGCRVESGANGVLIAATDMDCLGLGIETAPYPGFATDMQAQFMALLATCRGSSEIRETIFENRFMHVPELARMGADIDVSGGHAHIRGVRRLKAAPVMATDLRASVSLVLAGLAAEGKTVVNRVYHLDRGYARIEEKLSAVGARIFRKKG